MVFQLFFAHAACFFRTHSTLVDNNHETNLSLNGEVFKPTMVQILTLSHIDHHIKVVSIASHVSLSALLGNIQTQSGRYNYHSTATARSGVPLAVNYIGALFDFERLNILTRYQNVIENRSSQIRFWLSAFHTFILRTFDWSATGTATTGGRRTLTVASSTYI